MQQIKTFKDDLITRYGKPLYRVGFDLALGCPNRENKFGPGCIFCSADGSRARHLARDLDLASQCRHGIDYLQRRYQATAPYIAYFQSFTNTYAPVATLRRLYSEALSLADFKVVMISTRPDALPDEVLDYLAELNRDYEVWVELGVQTAHDRTLKRIRRGHDWACSADAVRRLAARGIKTVAHLILGLPEESLPDWLATARMVAALPFAGVKIHQLMVLRNTPLAAEYRAGNLPVLNEYEYAQGLHGVLNELPEELLVMRLTAEAAPEELIAPKWWMSKGQFLEFFQHYRLEGGEFPTVATADGSRTLYHPVYRQHFHSLAGAEAEAEHKFIEATALDQTLRRGDTVQILDVGFGLGGNSFAALNHAAHLALGKVAITALELDKRVLPAAMTTATPQDRSRLAQLMEHAHLLESGGTLDLHLGDARQSVQTLPLESFDLIFLDGFSPDVNPELWTYHFLRELKRVLKPTGRLVTYSSAFPIRGALLKLGLAVGETIPFGRKRGGTIAAKSPEAIERELSPKDRAILLTSTAGVPYMDAQLDAATAKILAHREKLVRRLRARGVPKWASYPTR